MTGDLEILADCLLRVECGGAEGECGGEGKVGKGTDGAHEWLL
jgi:hypothetical protein